MAIAFGGMKIINKEPKHWRDLQDNVALILNQSGYKAITPKTIKLARGNVEVDVFVEAKHEFLKNFICECKHWETSIPKEKVHAFRTIVQDSGAMIGIVISKVGFQAGAIEAAEYSNVVLKTWDEFQEMLLIPWVSHRFVDVRNRSRKLFCYHEKFEAYRKIDRYNLSKTAYETLVTKFSQISLAVYLLFFSNKLQKYLQLETISFENHEFSALDEWMEWLNLELDRGIREFERFFEKCPYDFGYIDKDNSLVDIICVDE